MNVIAYSNFRLWLADCSTLTFSSQSPGSLRQTPGLVRSGRRWTRPVDNVSRWTRLARSVETYHHVEHASICVEDEALRHLRSALHVRPGLLLLRRHALQCRRDGTESRLRTSASCWSRYSCWIRWRTNVRATKSWYFMSVSVDGPRSELRTTGHTHPHEVDLVLAGSRSHVGLVDVRLHRIMEGQLVGQLLQVLAIFLPRLSCVGGDREGVVHAVRELAAGVLVRIHCLNSFDRGLVSNKTTKINSEECSTYSVRLRVYQFPMASTVALAARPVLWYRRQVAEMTFEAFALSLCDVGIGVTKTARHHVSEDQLGYGGSSTACYEGSRV